jgi:hypothetical protein
MHFFFELLFTLAYNRRARKGEYNLVCAEQQASSRLRTDFKQQVPCVKNILFWVQHVTLAAENHHLLHSVSSMTDKIPHSCRHLKR